MLHTTWAVQNGEIVPATYFPIPLPAQHCPPMPFSSSSSNSSSSSPSSNTSPSLTTTLNSSPTSRRLPMPL
ncbi:hypothetical protein GGF41_008808 [Coemansia sp. RSA 2531]|nr:hypothetical protein GGF41_008808 [Coemansia sp. RSA 2531]